MNFKSSTDLSDFRPGGNAGIHQELAQYLREKIESGALQPGDRLPSLRELAELWHTNFFSVKLATDLLVKFGLLNKQHGRGMFVAPRAAGIRRVGLYTSKLYGSRSDRITFSVLRDILQEKFQARGIEPDVYVDDTPKGNYPTFQVREADLAHHLTNQQTGESATRDDLPYADTDAEAPDYMYVFGDEKDWQLQQAVAYLQGKKVQVSRYRGQPVDVVKKLKAEERRQKEKAAAAKKPNSPEEASKKVKD